MAIRSLHLTNSYHPASGGIRTFYTALLEAANRSKRHVRAVRVRILPHGVDTEGLGSQHRSEQAREDMLPPVWGRKQQRLATLCRAAVEGKNLPLLIDMMECLLASTRSHPSGARDYRLLVAGSGPLASWLESESARRVPGRIHFLGQVTNREALATLPANSDTFVHPNPREPFGIAPLEAMASGLPLTAPAASLLMRIARMRGWQNRPATPLPPPCNRSLQNQTTQSTKRSARGKPPNSSAGERSPPRILTLTTGSVRIVDDIASMR